MTEQLKTVSFVSSLKDMSDERIVRLASINAHVFLEHANDVPWDGEKRKPFFLRPDQGYERPTMPLWPWPCFPAHILTVVCFACGIVCGWKAAAFFK